MTLVGLSTALRANKLGFFSMAAGFSMAWRRLVGDGPGAAAKVTSSALLLIRLRFMAGSHDGVAE